MQINCTDRSPKSVWLVGGHRLAKIFAVLVYAVYEWLWTGVPLENGHRGSEDWPKDGEPALSPGVPGSGGDGATVISNLESLLAHVDNAAGEPGRRGRARCRADRPRRGRWLGQSGVSRHRGVHRGRLSLSYALVGPQPADGSPAVHPL